MGEDDFEESCPNCGSSKIVFGLRDGFYWIIRCQKCGFRNDASPFSFLDKIIEED